MVISAAVGEAKGRPTASAPPSSGAVREELRDKTALEKDRFLRMLSVSRQALTLC
jgi:hypothetical protein